MITVPELQNQVRSGNYLSLARVLTYVENELTGSAEFLRQLEPSATPVIGVTGPPGAGKSTLVNAIINQLAKPDMLIAVVAIDPTSPFNYGSLLGDRIRMAEQYNKQNVYIRSLASRGSLGGLSGKAIEITDVLKSAGFDYIIVETVGVGQSEVEIAGLADISLVVLVPESGDEIQNIKSGLMEIADIFVVNKADREGAETFSSNLKKLVHQKSTRTPVVSTVASTSAGVEELIRAIKAHRYGEKEHRILLLAEKAYRLIQQLRMRDVDKRKLRNEIELASQVTGFNLFRFVDTKISES